MRFPIALKLSLAVAVVLLAAIAHLAYTSYRSSYESLENEFGLALKHVAITGALQISGDDHTTIRRPADAKSPAFKRMRKALNKIRRANDIGKEHIYTFRGRSEKKLIFCVMLHKKTFVGHVYDVPAVNQPLIKRALAGEAVKTRLYTDAHGQWISGFAPLRSKRGKVAGILAVDYKVDRFLAAMRERVTMLVVQSLVIGLIGILVVILIGLGISRPLARLRDAAASVAAGDYDVKVSASSHDEIGDLAGSFNNMMKALKERLFMLKYISPHAKEMIEKAAGGAIDDMGESRNVVIFFSDMRDFTSFSANRSPEWVVLMLNIVLSEQSKIIDRYEGKIDKYVGDEVVAIFDGPRKVMNAAYASLEIQKRMKVLSREISFDHPIEVGVGISIGEIIIGNIGSDIRKDFTIIGNNVNLASRLCSIAPAGCICISSDMRRAIEADDGLSTVLKTDAEGEVKLKGFADPVHVFRLNYKFKDTPDEDSGSESSVTLF